MVSALDVAILWRGGEKKEEARRGRPRARFDAGAERLLGVPEANEASTGSTTGGGGLMRDRLGF